VAKSELTRKVSKAIVVVTTPDVCKSPTVPTPFVSYSKFDLSIMTADTVRMTRCVSFTKESRLSMTMADQGGVGGGLKSQVFGGMCRPFKGWSSTVRAQGSEVCRHDVIMEVNCAGPDGPGNTFGKVIYIESITCASISEVGEITVDEPKEKESDEADDENSSENENPKENAGTKADEGGFGKEAGQRIKNEIDGIKQSGEDLYDLATSPEARKKALDTAKETLDSAAKDPVGFGIEAGTEVANDIKEPFETAGGQFSKGDVGGAAASVGYGILNIFNPFKKVKILEKVGKLGKTKNKTKKKKRDSNNNKEGSDGGTIKRAPRSTRRIGLRKRFSSRKEAYESAKRAGNGAEPRLDYNDPRGPHYHPGVPQNHPKAHDHYFFPKGK
jgi:hypothetical protein